MKNNNFKKKSLKVFAIGNSFSVDGMEYLYQIAEDAGYDEIVLGNLFIGGAPISEHIRQIEEQQSDYIYYKNTTGIWEERYESSILDGLLDEDWDIITLQQVSYQAGMFEAYDDLLVKLYNYVNTHKTNPNAKLVWHMTWAYQKDSLHGGFVQYHNNQITMYDEIVSCVKQKILTNPVFEDIIPSGTAIQNLRTSSLGDTLTRDGFHLSFDKGRFCASLSWFITLTNNSIDGIEFKPDGINDKDLKMIKKAVNNAYKKPFEISDIGDENGL